MDKKKKEWKEKQKMTEELTGTHSQITHFLCREMACVHVCVCVHETHTRTDGRFGATHSNNRISPRFGYQVWYNMDENELVFAMADAEQSECERSTERFSDAHSLMEWREKAQRRVLAHLYNINKPISQPDEKNESENKIVHTYTHTHNTFTCLYGIQSLPHEVGPLRIRSIAAIIAFAAI